MKFADTSTPVVVLNCQLAALAVMRSLGPLGVRLYGVDADPSAPASQSRYCHKAFPLRFVEDHPAPYISGLLAIARELGRRAILIPTSDETTQAVADHADLLREFFMFQENPAMLVRQLASKREMFGLATRLGVPTPETIFPTSIDDVTQYQERGTFPVMLKGIYGNRLELRTRKKMVIVEDRTRLIEIYQAMEDSETPNLMLQEYIPGTDDQVYIFNGYFDKHSDCLLGFTGHKIRQFPIHVGCASLGECRWVEDVATTTIRFMKELGYRGILDIGYRLDPRDGRYKVLDINPRIGQAFRLFVATNDHDVAKAMYLDLTGQPPLPAVSREGRRWMIEDFDLISSYHYYCEGTLKLSEYVRSFRGLEETAWFDRQDLGPFLIMVRALLKRARGWLRKTLVDRIGRVGRGIRNGLKQILRTIVPLGLRKYAALVIQRQSWISDARSRWWSVELVRDLAQTDIDGFHEFLWKHHLGYAETYETESRFGSEHMRLSRKMFFADLRTKLDELGLAAQKIDSALEVGCSLGYQLRWMETEILPNATVLTGVDIDEYAVRSGTDYLHAAESRVNLKCADMRDLETLLGTTTYDLVVCTGVLMYLNETAASEVVRVMLRHSRVLALAGLAHPSVDNESLAKSSVRGTDTTYVHNFDRMVTQAGGKIVGRRWEGSRDVEGNTIYFVFATWPGSSQANVSYPTREQVIS